MFKRTFQDIISTEEKKDSLLDICAFNVGNPLLSVSSGLVPWLITSDFELKFSLFMKVMPCELTCEIQGN